MTNTEELYRRIKESGLKKKYVAEALKLSRQGFKNKCENKYFFTTEEVNTLCKLLKITKLTDKEHIFFATNVD